MFKQISLSLALLASLMVGVSSAQQLEANSAGGSLTSNGQDPVPGMPYTVTDSSGMPLEISGSLPNTPYLLVQGQLAATSSAFPALGGQFIDIDLNQPYVVIGDGFFGGGALPAILFALDVNGRASWLLPTNPSLAASGIRLSYQAMTSDPASPPFNRNVTAAGEFEIVQGMVFEGDDDFQNYPLQGGALSIFGNSYSSIDVSTNGWMSFGQAAQHSAVNPSSSNFVDGRVGINTGGATAPAIAAHWRDLVFSNRSTQRVIIAEDTSSQTIQITWQDGDYFPQTGFGTVSCTIQGNMGMPIVTIDYGLYAPVSAPSTGIVGVSDGDNASGPDLSVDLATGGSVNASTQTVDQVSYFQDFSGANSGSAEAIDLAGLVITFVDLNGNGRWDIF